MKHARNLFGKYIYVQSRGMCRNSTDYREVKVKEEQKGMEK